MKTFEQWWEEMKRTPEIRHLRIEPKVEELIHDAWNAGQFNAPLPMSIQEALNSGDVLIIAPV